MLTVSKGFGGLDGNLQRCRHSPPGMPWSYARAGLARPGQFLDMLVWCLDYTQRFPVRLPVASPDYHGVQINRICVDTEEDDDDPMLSCTGR